MKKRYYFFMLLFTFVSGILKAQNYATELKDGSYYRVSSPSYTLYMTEVDGNSVKSVALDETNYAQIWKLNKKGSGFVFQNALTGRNIQSQTTTSAYYTTGTTAYALYPAKVSGSSDTWTIANSSSDGSGLHTASSQGYNVVRWSTNADASRWQFEEMTVSEEELEKARAPYEAFNELTKNKSTFQSKLRNLFVDYACTTLKDEIQALSDDELAANEDFAALNADMQAMVLKIKNDTWQQFTNSKTGYSRGYEKFFRVADYRIYSNYVKMAQWPNFIMSNSFGRLENPTGIVANPGDIIYIYVDQAPKEDCTLKLETVSTEGVPGNHATGTQTTLSQGLNAYTTTQQEVLYIFYQLDNTEKYLADYPDIKIHIEGGQLNGYWDATRDMTNADWKLLQQDLLKAPYVNLKTKHLVFQMDAPLVKSCEPDEMEGLMRIWENICANEDRYMGVEDFEGRYNNIWNVFSIDYNYMFSSTYGTYYNNSTLPTVMNYAEMRKPGSLWGPSHEIGHNHQNTINVVGTTESSNNLFSNINTFEQGIQTTRRQLPNDSFYELAMGTPWLGRNIWNTTSMYFQLYLYFHVMHHDDQFYPNLFRALRKDPIDKWNGQGGKTDYLHLAKKICDVAQADLSEFFESYGMFVPVDNYHVGDYADYYMTTPQSDIDAAKKYMQKYTKKLGNIMFIDDHITPMKKADPDNIFEGIPTDTYKRNNLDQHNELASKQPVGDAGDYEVFDGHTAYDTNSDYYTISGNTITFKGTGYVGHKVYDLEGNLIWATNASEATIPSSIKSLFPSKVVVVAAEENMNDVPCPYYKIGSPVYQMSMNFADGTTKTWWAIDNVDKYMPENAVAVLTKKEAPDALKASTNVIDADGNAQRIVINGDKAFYLPTNATAASLSFKKSGTGYQALTLPFALRHATTIDGTVMKPAEGLLEAGKPVVIENDANYQLSNVSLTAGEFAEAEAAYVLASDGKNVAEASDVTPFTYRFDAAFAITIADAINDILSGPDADSQRIYDLQGRRISKVTKSGIYIINGKQTLVK